MVSKLHRKPYAYIYYHTHAKGREHVHTLCEWIARLDATRFGSALIFMVVEVPRDTYIFIAIMYNNLMPTLFVPSFAPAKNSRLSISVLLMWPVLFNSLL